MSEIPTTTKRVPAKKAKRDAAYKMYVDTSKAANELLASVDDATLEGMVGDQLRLMMPPDGAEELTLPAEVFTQLSLFANAYLTRVLYERCKRS